MSDEKDFEGEREIVRSHFILVWREELLVDLELLLGRSALYGWALADIWELGFLEGLPC